MCDLPDVSIPESEKTEDLTVIPVRKQEEMFDPDREDDGRGKTARKPGRPLESKDKDVRDVADSSFTQERREHLDRIRAKSIAVRRAKAAKRKGDKEALKKAVEELKEVEKRMNEAKKNPDGYKNTHSSESTPVAVTEVDVTPPKTEKKEEPVKEPTPEPVKPVKVTTNPPTEPREVMENSDHESEEDWEREGPKTYTMEEMGQFIAMYDTIRRSADTQKTAPKPVQKPPANRVVKKHTVVVPHTNSRPIQVSQASRYLATPKKTVWDDCF